VFEVRCVGASQITQSECGCRLRFAAWCHGEAADQLTGRGLWSGYRRGRPPPGLLFAWSCEKVPAGTAAGDEHDIIPIVRSGDGGARPGSPSLVATADTSSGEDVLS